MLSSDRHTTALNKQSYTKKKLASNQTTYERKILFVSGLRSDVRADDIRRHFTGCVKVKIKQNKSKSCLKSTIETIKIWKKNRYHLRHAFVFHHTSKEAKRNLQRPIDAHRFGAKCSVEYANDYLDSSPNNHNKIVLRGIPENVSEDDLRLLFDNCHILRYSPARVVCQGAATMEAIKKRKILLGYEQFVS